VVSETPHQLGWGSSTTESQQDENGWGTDGWWVVLSPWFVMRPFGHSSQYLFTVLILIIIFSGKFWHHSNYKNPGQKGKKFFIGEKTHQCCHILRKGV